MCNGKQFDKSKREVNQTDSEGGLGRRKTDREEEDVNNVYLDITVKILIKGTEAQYEILQV